LPELITHNLYFYRFPKQSWLWLFMLFILPYSAAADTPSAFTAEYEARYGGFKASAERSLQISDNGQVEMNTMLRLKMLGKTLSTIKEKSVLTADIRSGELKPVTYSFIQSGIGKRSRHIAFDWEAGQAKAEIGNEQYEIPLELPVADNLSAYLEVRNQLLAGETEIIFPAIDKGKIEEYHFRVLGEEDIATSLGLFRTVKIERVREPESKRSTIMWLALDWDFLLVKLEQLEQNSRGIKLELRQARVMDTSVTGKSQKQTESVSEL